MPARRSISLILSTRYRLLNGPVYYSFQKSGQIVQFNVAKGSCSVDTLMGGLQCSVLIAAAEVESLENIPPTIVVEKLSLSQIFFLMELQFIPCNCAMFHS
jgi:hypothetical protein